MKQRFYEFTFLYIHVNAVEFFHYQTWFIGGCQHNSLFLVISEELQVCEQYVFGHEEVIVQLHVICFQFRKRAETINSNFWHYVLQ